MSEISTLGLELFGVIIFVFAVLFALRLLVSIGLWIGVWAAALAAEAWRMVRGVNDE